MNIIEVLDLLISHNWNSRLGRILRNIMFPI